METMSPVTTVTPDYEKLRHIDPTNAQKRQMNGSSMMDHDRIIFAHVELAFICDQVTKPNTDHNKENRDTNNSAKPEKTITPIPWAMEPPTSSL